MNKISGSFTIEQIDPIRVEFTQTYSDLLRLQQAVKAALESDPPYGAQVSFDAPRGENGWNAPALAPWLSASLDKALHSYLTFREKRG